MGEPGAGERLPVELGRLDVEVRLTAILGLDDEGAALEEPGVEVKGGALEQRTAELVDAVARRHRVEAERAEHVPGAHRPGVVVARQPVGPRGELGGEQRAHLGLRSRGGAGEVVEERGVEVGLVAHVEVLLGEELVQPGDEALRAAHQGDQPGHVMRHEPAVDPAVGLGEVLVDRPGGVERLDPAAVAHLALHEAGVRVPHVAVVPGAFLVARLFVRLAHRGGHPGVTCQPDGRRSIS